MQTFGLSDQWCGFSPTDRINELKEVWHLLLLHSITYLENFPLLPLQNFVYCLSDSGLYWFRDLRSQKEECFSWAHSHWIGSYDFHIDCLRLLILLSDRVKVELLIRLIYTNFPGKSGLCHLAKSREEYEWNPEWSTYWFHHASVIKN